MQNNFLKWCANQDAYGRAHPDEALWRQGNAIVPAVYARVTCHKLSVCDEHLVLGAAGFWREISADDAALRAHFHKKVNPKLLFGYTVWMPAS